MATTVEINDAVFCTHLKEVVRLNAFTPHCYPTR